MKKILLIIFDGLADRPIKELGNKTPLEAANTPNLDKLAAKGVVGLQNALKKGEYPTSEEAHFEILGYDHVKDLPGRGVLEALGIGVPLKRNELALRVDFGTVDEGLNVVDPRAGNIKDVHGFAKFIGEQKIGSFDFKLYPSLAHRGILTISGPAVTKEIHHHSTIVTDTDPHKAENHQGGVKVLRPEPVDDSPEARATAKALWDYQEKVYLMLTGYVENQVRTHQGLLPANFLLTRGAGFIKEIPSFTEKYGLNAACVAGAPLYKGIAEYFGMDVIDVPGATGGVDTDVQAKVNKSLDLLRSGYDFVFMHLKGADVVAEEDGDWEAKVRFLERADKALGPLLKFDGVLAITGDHATPCILHDHSDDPVPIMLVGGETGSSGRFNERDAAEGDLGYMKGSEIMPLLIKEANKNN